MTRDYLLALDKFIDTCLKDATFCVLAFNPGELDKGLKGVPLNLSKGDLVEGTGEFKAPGVWGWYMFFSCSLAVAARTLASASPTRL